MHSHPHLSQILARQRVATLMADGGSWRRRRSSRAAETPIAATLPANLVRGETLVVITVTSEVVVLGRITEPTTA
jgi:hypothetical protein